MWSETIQTFAYIIRQRDTRRTLNSCRRTCLADICANSLWSPSLSVFVSYFDDQWNFCFGVLFTLKFQFINVCFTALPELPETLC